MQDIWCGREELSDPTKKQTHNTVCAYASGRISSAAARKEKKRREEVNRENANSNSTPTHGLSLPHSLSNSDGKAHGSSTPTIRGSGNGEVINGNGYGDSSCRTDGDSNSLGTAGLLTGMDGILEGVGNSPNVAGAGAAWVERMRVELIDKILECEETEEIIEDQSTLTVSFSIRDRERRRCGCYEKWYA